MTLRPANLVLLIRASSAGRPTSARMHTCVHALGCLMGFTSIAVLPEARHSPSPVPPQLIFAAMFDSMMMRHEQSVPSELREATQELNFLRSMVDQSQQGRNDMEWTQDLHREREFDPWAEESRPQKWSRPDQKGQKGNGTTSTHRPRKRSRKCGTSRAS